MKSLKQYIENHTNESLSDGEGVLSDPERDNRIIETWVKENYRFNRQLKINDDLTVDCPGSVSVKKQNITSLTNGLFRWGEIKGDFDCSNCFNLTSLEGSPEEVSGDFDCYNCGELKSLEGAPESIGGTFDCSHCKNITSLEGAPESIGGAFVCSFCKSLKSLKDGPKRVKTDLYCYSCPDLVITDSDHRKYNIRS